MTFRIDIKNNDEIGNVSLLFNTFLETLQQMIKQINENAKTLGAASTEQMGATVNEIAQNSAKTREITADAVQKSQVASDAIQELAKPTATATQDIKSQIEKIQTSTRNGSEVVSQISKIIGDVDGMVSSVAAAAEEQSTTTGEIAGNVSQSSQGLNSINEKLMSEFSLQK